MRSSTYRRFDRDTEAKLIFLGQPVAYPEGTHDVQCIETHMAWVFLTDRHAFKLKKPVRYDFLDFSTVEARRLDCAREIELNRRLAAGVYLDLVPLAKDAHGLLALGGDGKVVDWLVKMRRLPRKQMLDWQLEHGCPRPDALRPAALLLAEFYRDARTLEVSPKCYLRALEDAVRDNVAALALPANALPRAVLARIRDGQLEFLDRHYELLRERAMHVVEGHGDLRSEHICLVDPPAIIDCLEFNREFRIVDPVDELAFLMLECQVIGQTWAGEVFLEIYSEATGDRPPTPLFDFYKSRRALLRAKLAAWHLHDSAVANTRGWLLQAESYLNLASDFLDEALQT